MDVPATSESPGLARLLIAALLPGWGLAELSEDAQLVVSELVANAYRHAPGTDSFELELAARGADGVRLSLADGSSIRPIISELSDERPSGRGMRIVAAIATSWGAEDHHGGKRVWVDLDRRD